jgi:hypothetical protein
MRSQPFIKPLLFMGRGFLERSHHVRGGDRAGRWVNGHEVVSPNSPASLSIVSALVATKHTAGR